MNRMTEQEMKQIIKHKFGLIKTYNGNPAVACECCQLILPTNNYNLFKEHLKSYRHRKGSKTYRRTMEDYVEEFEIDNKEERKREECERRGITEEEYEILHEEYN